MSQPRANSESDGQSAALDSGWHLDAAWLEPGAPGSGPWLVPLARARLDPGAPDLAQGADAPASLVTLGLDQASTGAAETEHMSATGRVKLRRSISSIAFLTRADNYRMQTLFWSYLSATFDMRPFLDLSETFFAVDAYQQLLILLTNGVHADRTEINQGILELGNRLCTTGTDLVQLQSDIYAYSVLYNIIRGLPPFESSSKLLLTVVDGLQRGRNIGILPQQVQTQVVKILDGCRQRIARADRTLPSVRCLFPFCLHHCSTCHPYLRPL